MKIKQRKFLLSAFSVLPSPFSCVSMPSFCSPSQYTKTQMAMTPKETHTTPLLLEKKYPGAGDMR